VQTIKFPALELMERLSAIALAHGMTLEDTLAMHDRLVVNAGFSGSQGKADRLAEALDRINKEKRDLRFWGGPVEPQHWGRENGPEATVEKPRVKVQLTSSRSESGMETHKLLARVNGPWLVFGETQSRSDAEHLMWQLTRLNETSEVIPYPSVETPDSVITFPLFSKNQQVSVITSPGKALYSGRIAQIGTNAGEFYYKVLSDGVVADCWTPEHSIEAVEEARSSYSDCPDEPTRDGWLPESSIEAPDTVKTHDPKPLYKLRDRVMIPTVGAAKSQHVLGLVESVAERDGAFHYGIAYKSDRNSNGGCEVFSGIPGELLPEGEIWGLSDEFGRQGLQC
jgi:hypothetical protein